MDAVWNVIQDWRFFATALLLGALLGKLIFMRTPPPKGSELHFARFVRAGAAGVAAKMSGAKPVELIASVVGAHAAGALNAALTRQRRGFLILGLVIAALALVPIFLVLPLATQVPDWAFGVIAALGAYRTWRLW